MRMPGRNSRTTLKAAVEAKERPALAAILPGPFQVYGPHALEMPAAAITPVVAETENEFLPSAWRAVNVLTSACRVRGQIPDRDEAKYRVSSPNAREAP
jgi:hypothetical protein